MNIHDIESLSQSEVAEMSIEVIDVKGHRVYFTDLGGAFGYSALVFSDGMHLTHANDYALHHRYMNEHELREWYISSMFRKLFTEEELGAPCSCYDEECMRKRYLSNIYSQQRPYISMFHIGERNPVIEDDIKEMHPSYVGLAYYWDKEFVDKMSELYQMVESACKSSRSPKYMEQAFYSEMSNHEYGYSMDKDYEVISVFEKVPYLPYGSTEDYLDKTSWDDEWKAAYRSAKRRQLEHVETV